MRSAYGRQSKVGIQSRANKLKESATGVKTVSRRGSSQLALESVKLSKNNASKGGSRSSRVKGTSVRAPTQPHQPSGNIPPPATWNLQQQTVSFHNDGSDMHELSQLTGPSQDANGSGAPLRRPTTRAQSRREKIAASSSGMFQRSLMKANQAPKRSNRTMEAHSSQRLPSMNSVPPFPRTRAPTTPARSQKEQIEKRAQMRFMAGNFNAMPYNGFGESHIPSIPAGSSATAYSGSSHMTQSSLTSSQGTISSLGSQSLPSLAAYNSGLRGEIEDIVQSYMTKHEHKFLGKLRQENEANQHDMFASHLETIQRKVADKEKEVKETLEALKADMTSSVEAQHDEVLRSLRNTREECTHAIESSAKDAKSDALSSIRAATQDGLQSLTAKGTAIVESIHDKVKKSATIWIESLFAKFQGDAKSIQSSAVVNVPTKTPSSKNSRTSQNINLVLETTAKKRKGESTTKDGRANKRAKTASSGTRAFSQDSEFCNQTQLHSQDTRKSCVTPISDLSKKGSKNSAKLPTTVQVRKESGTTKVRRSQSGRRRGSSRTKIDLRDIQGFV